METQCLRGQGCSKRQLRHDLGHVEQEGAQVPADNNRDFQIIAKRGLSEREVEVIEKRRTESRRARGQGHGGRSGLPQGKIKGGAEVRRLVT